jgi:hypothetical protein
MNTLKYLALAAALALASGCNDDAKAKPDGAAINVPDGGAGADGAIAKDAGGTTPDGGMVTPDGGGVTPDGGATSIALVDFVTGLIKNSTTATAVPETLEDKQILDTMDPAAFDKLLGL